MTAIWVDGTGIIVDSTGVLVSEDCCCGGEVTVDCAGCVTDRSPAFMAVTISGITNGLPFSVDCCNDQNGTFMLANEGDVSDLCCRWFLGELSHCSCADGQREGGPVSRMSMVVCDNEDGTWLIEVQVRTSVGGVIRYSITVNAEQDCCDFTDLELTDYLYDGGLCLGSPICDGDSSTCFVTAVGC